MRSAAWSAGHQFDPRGYFEFPERVTDFFINSEKAGELRVELLEGAAIYKMYIRLPQDDV